MTANESNYPARWWDIEPNGRIVCELCPRKCKLNNNQRGLCYVRKNQDQKLILTTYGFSSGYCIDPIEKKPLNHFYPGSSVLSFGTAGCNLTCKFCQNWDISKSRDNHRLTSQASPEEIANAALNYNCKSIAYTYNDPIIFAEYAIDTAISAREKGIKNVAVTAGYINRQPAIEFFNQMDAANVDLKAFTDSFYYKYCSAKFNSVLDTLALIHHETKCHLEITTLIITDLNDSILEISELANWIATNLSPEIPLHLTAFHPAWKMHDIPPTKLSTLINARKVAIDNGLKFVYIGNVHDEDGSTTFCPKCNQKLIIRNGYQINLYELASQGNCAYCGYKIYGAFDTIFNQGNSQFGNKRIPVTI